MVHVTNACSPKRPANGFLVSITAVLAVLAKRANRLSGKHKAARELKRDDWKMELRSSPKPKRLLSNISSKTMTFVRIHHHKRKKEEEEEEEEGEEWGYGGVWQKAILMGDKCEPLNFSGVIYYDSNGKQMNEIPLKSPRASPMPGYLTRL